MRTLCEILRHARAQAGISQMELALRLGYSTRHISFVETGRTRPGRNLVTDSLTETGAPDSVRNAALLQLSGRVGSIAEFAAESGA